MTRPTEDEIKSELLEALRGFVEYFEADFDQPEEYFDALRAIKKATGGTKSEQGFEADTNKTYIAEDMSRTMSQTDAVILVYFLADLTEDKSKDERLAMTIVKHMIENSGEDQ